MEEKSYLVIRNVLTNEICLSPMEQLIVPDDLYKQILDCVVPDDQFNITFSRTKDQFNSLRVQPVDLNLIPTIITTPVNDLIIDSSPGDPIVSPLTIENSGDGILTITDITGLPNGPLSIINMPRFPFYIPNNGGTYDLNVRFNPPSTASTGIVYNAIIRINHNDPATTNPNETVINITANVT